MLNRRGLITGITTAGMVAIAGCSGTPEADEAVEIVEDEFTTIREYDSPDVPPDYGVVGTARNVSESTLDIFLTVIFYDNNDVRLDEFNIDASSVGPGDEFRFEAEYLSDDPDNMSYYEFEVEIFE